MYNVDFSRGKLKLLVEDRLLRLQTRRVVQHGLNKDTWFWLALYTSGGYCSLACERFVSLGRLRLLMTMVARRRGRA